MKTLQIERRANCDLGEFFRECVLSPGRPVIVTDAMERWPALARWTWDFLKQGYGSDFATAPTGLDCDVAKLTTLSAYLDFLANPGDSLPGFWVNNHDGKPLLGQPVRDQGDPFYLLGWKAFQQHPELYADIDPAPYFVEDWLPKLPADMLGRLEQASGREYWSIYIGPKGAFSKLHSDFWGTHAYLAQVRGRKRVIMFSPEDSPFLYGGQVDPERPDINRFPLFSQATVLEGEIGPGDMLFMPADWWHCVRATEASITVSHNFFNGSNVRAHVDGLAGRFPELAHALAEYAARAEAKTIVAGT